jgi:alkanesulfonate monooxygenase SsuD/methylene tetrahydromethanopterin reductase-like flavin-dependent oxidoreductase (luciferase family)
VRVGIALPQYDRSVPGEDPLRVETLVAWAQAAEAAGFTSAWLSDHLFLELDRYGLPGRQGCFEPVVTLAFLARRTTTIRLGVLTFCEALRPPAVLAKAIASLDAVAGGRLDVALGAGWFEPEYEAIGLPLPAPGVRLQRLAEAIDVIRPMLAGGPVTFTGRHHHVDGATNDPPLGRPARLLVGGKGDRMLRLIAERADGWNAVWAWTPETYRERLAVLEAACAAVGRDPATVERTLGLYTLVGHDEADLRDRFAGLVAASGPVLAGVDLATWRQGRLVGTVEQVAEQLATWHDLGIAEVVADLGALPFGVRALDDLEPFAAAVRAVGTHKPA